MDKEGREREGHISKVLQHLNCSIQFITLSTAAYHKKASGKCLPDTNSSNAVVYSGGMPQ